MATNSPIHPRQGNHGATSEEEERARTRIHSTTTYSNKVTGRFQFIRHIGSGSFGEIYSGVDLLTKEQVAVKVEPMNAAHPQLHNEYFIYHNYLEDVRGFPKVYRYGRTSKHNYFAMSMLGNNLEKLFDLCQRRFSAKTLLMIADQLVERIGTLHEKSGYLHRDLKPENMLMGLGKNKSMLYLIDLGLAKGFVDKNTGQHIVQRKIRKSLTGTARYASINAHYGKDQSRRDDMEAAAYVLIYLCKGRLPWQGIKASNKKERYEKICEKKMSTKPNELCYGLMQEFKLYLEYVKKLEFSEKPDYDLLRGMFQEAMFRNNFVNDGQFDWFSRDSSRKAEE